MVLHQDGFRTYRLLQPYGCFGQDGSLPRAFEALMVTRGFRKPENRIRVPARALQGGWT